MKQKKLFNLVMVVLIGVPLVAAAAYALAMVKANAMDNAEVATINGEPIEVRQFKQASLLHRANVLAEFTRQYGSDGSGDFWSMTFGGTTPAERLKEKTLQGLIRSKVILIAAKEHGLISDIHYASLMDAREQENDRRKLALAKGEVIYGPVQYSEQDYEVFLLNNLELRLQERLKGTFSNVSEDDLMAWYEENKEKLFDQGRRIKVMIIRIPYSTEGSKHARQEAEARMDEVVSRLDAGESFEALASEYNEVGYYAERIFDASTERYDMKYDAKLRLAASQLQVGQISNVMDHSSDSSQGDGYYLMKSIESSAAGILPFNEVKEAVATAFTKEQFLSYISTLVDEAIVEVNPEIYGRIIME
jgi:hypothetical protein